VGTNPKTKCDLSATRAYDLIAIADGRSGQLAERLVAAAFETIYEPSKS
jgi:hypothetical protein